MHYIYIDTYVLDVFDFFTWSRAVTEAAINLQSQRPGSEPARIRFDGFEADLRTEELSRAGRKVRLAHQSFRVLVVLLERPGQLVTRQELRDRLWPAGTVLEYDQGLNTAVNRLREALKDSAEAPRYIETLPKRGYRFIAAVEPQASSAPDIAHETAPAPHLSSSAAPDLSCEPADRDTVNEPRVSPAGPDASVGTPHQAGLAIAAKSGMDVSQSMLRRNILFVTAAGVGVAVIIAGLVLLATRHRETHPSSGRHVILFTSLPGEEVAPTFSPDGSQIAFAWNGGADAGHQFDLYVKSLGSERLLRLTHQPANWLNPAWSPDGSSIAFASQKAEGGSLGLFVIPALGGSERSIVSTEVAVGLSMQISWSPDSRQLAYAAYGLGGAARVYLVQLDSLNTQPLRPAPECVEAGQPAFSPDGQQLALVCVSSAAVYAIYVVQLPHGPLRKLAAIMGNPQGLAWARDGEHLIFSNDPGNGGELWQLSLSGEMTQLPFAEEASAPAVDPKGGRIAYVRGRATIDIWRADLTATHPEESATRLIYSTRTQAAARYSPDGARIAFQSNRSGSTEIWLAEADGSDPERITSFNGPYTSAPSWCSDGRRIAFDSRASGLSAIYIEDIRERVPRKVVTSEKNLSLPTWSQDCRWLFAIRDTEALYRLPSSGGPAQRFSEQPSNLAVVAGDRVVFTVMRADGVLLWSKPVSGGVESALQNMPRLGYGDAWLATTAGIYYTDSRTKAVTVSFYDFTTHTTRTLMSLRQPPTPAGIGLGVSPDGRWVLYSQIEKEESEIILAPMPN